MALEIEHKYLVRNDGYKALASSALAISQGYLCRQPERTVRIRLKGEKGFITVKGISHGATRMEFEYEIKREDAESMLSMCEPPVIEKTRYLVPYEGYVWEVDEFHGSLNGLVTAEIELPSEDTSYDLPEFVGENVTGDPAYFNSNLG